MRIIWVDDDVTFLKTVRAIFKKETDTEFQTAASGEEALKLMGNNPADLLFVDLVMVRMSGMELLSKTKHDFPSTEVIVVTGQASINDAVSAMKCGAFDFIVKPIHSELVKEKIAVLQSVVSYRREMEDFRHAKEVIESGAQQDISSLEIKLNCCMRRLETVLKIINSDIDNEEKIREISNTISTVENQHRL
ncbi:MAG: response regulator [Chitinispirillaceae bacterium]